MAKVCSKCGEEMEVREVVSMGPGYREYEDLAPQWHCSKCGAEEEVVSQEELALRNG